MLAYTLMRLRTNLQRKPARVKTVSYKEIQTHLYKHYKLVKMYSNIIDTEFLYGHYKTRNLFQKKAFRTVKEVEGFLSLFAGSQKDLYRLQRSVERIKKYTEI